MIDGFELSIVATRVNSHVFLAFNHGSACVKRSGGQRHRKVGHDKALREHFDAGPLGNWYGIFYRPLAVQQETDVARQAKQENEYQPNIAAR